MKKVMLLAIGALVLLVGMDVEYPEDVNPDPDRERVIASAIYKSDVGNMGDIIKNYVKSPQELDALRFRRSPLLYLLMTQDPLKLEEFLSYNTNVNVIDQAGFKANPLVTGSIGGEGADSLPECIYDLFLSYGLDPNLQDFEGNTLLHGAIARKDIPLMKKLLFFGASPFIKNRILDDLENPDSEYANAYEYAQKLFGMKDASVYSVILDNQKRYSGDFENLKNNMRFRFYVETKQYDKALNFFWLHDVDINFQDENGDTILHRAFKKGNLERIGFLMQFKPNELIQNDQGQIPANLFTSGYDL